MVGSKVGSSVGSKVGETVGVDVLGWEVGAVVGFLINYRLYQSKVLRPRAFFRSHLNPPFWRIFS